jgi:hypothetical protein
MHCSAPGVHKMRTLRGRLLAIGVLAGVLSSCVGPQLLDLNSDLTNLTRQRDDLKKMASRGDPAKRQEANAQLIKVDGELKRLTETAHGAARQSFDNKAKISYYRIAATAGWESRDSRTVAIANEGSAVCNANAGFDLSPRDCVMLLIIPDLLVNDVSISNAEQLARQGNQGRAARYSPVVGDLLDAYERLGSARQRAASTGASQETLLLIDAHRKKIGGSITNLVVEAGTKGSRGEAHTLNMGVMCRAVRDRAPDFLPGLCGRFA